MAKSPPTKPAPSPSTPPRVTWARKFREAREEARLSQRALADLMKVGYRSVQKIESDGFVPAPDALSEAWAALGKDLSRFLPPPRPNRSGRPPGSPGSRIDDPQMLLLASRVKARREACGMSQSDLGNALEPPMVQPSISKIEMGLWLPSADVIRRLAEALECDPSVLDPDILPEHPIHLVPSEPASWAALTRQDVRALAEIGSPELVRNRDVPALVKLAVEQGVALIFRGDLPARGGDDED